MASIEKGVSQHYSAYNVLPHIREGLAATGLDPDHISPADLKAVDEFHIGGAEATAALLDDLDIGADTDVLDIGCGIGGPARTIAQRTGARVTGVDLTPQFVEAARALTRMAGMDGAVRFEVGSAIALPFDDGSFDTALLLHVGMNIPDKAALFREAYRVLRRGGLFAVYDVMKTGEAGVTFPVPWAERAELSALEPPGTYRDGAAKAGFALDRETDRTPLALEFFARIRAQAQSAAPAPLGLHLLLGPTIGQKMGNMIDALRSGNIAPMQMIFRKA